MDNFNNEKEVCLRGESITSLEAPYAETVNASGWQKEAAKYRRSNMTTKTRKD
jgi:hypothetical protein